MPGAGTDHTRPALEGGPVVILVEPQLGENIDDIPIDTNSDLFNALVGSLRALGDPALPLIVAPRERWLHAKTRAAAAGAEFILDKAAIYPGVREAIADLDFVYATTARERSPSVSMKTLLTLKLQCTTACRWSWAKPSAMSMIQDHAVDGSP